MFMTRKKMLDEIIKKFGFENEYSVQFAEAAEWLGLLELGELFNEIMKIEIGLDEEDEDE